VGNTLMHGHTVDGGLGYIFTSTLLAVEMETPMDETLLNNKSWGNMGPPTQATIQFSLLKKTNMQNML
jgi:hypothetical protein